MTFLQILFYFLHWLVLKTWHLISLCVLWFWPSAGISWNVIGGNSLRPEVKLSSSQENCFLLPIAWGATTQHFLNQIVCLKFSLIFVLFVCFLLKVKGFPTSCASRWQTSTRRAHLWWWIVGDFSVPSAKVQIDKWPFPFLRVGLFVIHLCFEWNSLRVTLWASKLDARFSWKTLTLSQLKAVVPVPSTGVKNRSWRSLGFPDKHRVNAGFSTGLTLRVVFCFSVGPPAL